MKLEQKEITPFEDADEELHQRVVVEEEVNITENTMRGIILLTAESMIVDLHLLLLHLFLLLLIIILILLWIHAVHLIHHRIHTMIQEGHTHLLLILILDENIRQSQQQGILMITVEGVTILE